MDWTPVFVLKIVDCTLIKCCKLLDWPVAVEKNIPDAVLRVVLKKLDWMPVIVLKFVDWVFVRVWKTVDWKLTVEKNTPAVVLKLVLK